MAFLALLFRFGKLRRHGVERFRKDAELIAALHRMTAAEVSLRDCSRTFGEQAQRLAELLGEDDGEPKRREKRQQQRQRERHGIQTFQSDAGIRNLLVIPISGLNLLGILLQLPRYRLNHLEYT